MAYPTSPSPTSLPPPLPDDFDTTWYGNIQYLINISAVGAISCLFIFLLVKLRSDHRRIPGPTALATKLLAVWHAAAREIALFCGADAAQFLVIEGGTFAILSAATAIALLVLLPLNLYAGTAAMDDQFSKTTITHIPKGSILLWVHVFFGAGLVGLVHKGICKVEDWLRITRFRDGLTAANSTAVFTVMVQGVPKVLANEQGPLEEYFQGKYPGKVFRVIVPVDLCHLDDLVEDLVKVRDDISKLVAKMDAQLVYNDDDDDIGGDDEEGRDLLEEGRIGLRSGNRVRRWWRKAERLWDDVCGRLGWTDDNRLRRLQEVRAELEAQVAAYKEGRGPGAGVAFVVFKDVFTANRAVKDFGMEKRMRIGRFFSITELQLERNQWNVERAPLASDIYWSHLGSSKLSLKLRRVFVNTLLLLMLLFFSSPLAVISALQRAVRIINAEAMDNAQSWLSWLQSSSWFAAIFLQFLPNVLVFVSMYILIPAALSYLSKFERHITVSGEQRAALIKMVCFFLVNLIVLRGLVESSLENTILSMGRCYLDGEDCRRIEQYMSASFLAKSCLSSLAFLITCTFLGISFDLLAPIPWIKRNLQKFRKNDMLQLVPEETEEYPVDSDTFDSLRRPLISEDAFNPGATNGGRLNVIDLQGHDLSVYPVSRTSPIPKQKFDFAQYYAFNLTIFALTMIYSSFAPLVVPVGAIYFGYRYMVDKYNFLYVYRVRGFPAGNDGKLMDTVLSVMRFCVDLYLVSMLIFFSIHGDSMKLQAIFTLGVFVMYKLLPSGSDGLQPASLQGMQTIDQVVEGPIDYEVFSQPKFESDRIL
ncbi:CSC1-like protein At4g35870 [Silene latifolia]|uniref:CSC1-like protein At4g35870 n=1 Tax=Silene latifolia TaxID=37657 RepID=UPI003D775399